MLNNELFYSYVDDTEKEFMAIESEFDIEMRKAYLALEYADRLYEIKLKQSDLKVLNESGTHDDISFLYEAASKEAGEKKKNIFMRMFDAIRKFIENIIEKVRKLFTKEKQKELDSAIANGTVTKIHCSKDPTQMLKALEDSVKKMGQFLKPGFHVTDETGQKIFSIQKTLVTTTEAIGAGVLSAKLAKPYIDKLEKYLNECKLQSKTWEEYLDSYDSFKRAGMSDEQAQRAAEENSACTKQVAEFMRKETQVVNTTIGDIINGINKSLNDAKGAVDKTVKKGQDMMRDTKAGNDLLKSGIAGVNKNNAKELGRDIRGTNESADVSLESMELEETCNDIMMMIDQM